MHADERAQNTAEYLLATGVVVVVMIAALLGFDRVVPEVLDYVCPGADTANGTGIVGACIP